MKEQKNKKQSIADREEEILEFWNKNKIFEKSLQKNEGKESFVFYDGPPFATGLPHYGHLVAGTIKDVIPRYETMRGKYVRRVWGWDCHGLPIENLIEKELGLNSKKEIEEVGIGVFNEKARENVLRYEEEWKRVIPRMGRWIDMDHPYMTMDASYTESVWWAFSELFKKDLIYKDYKSMHICPRCETTLANSEVTMNYADVKDISVTAKFELVEESPNPDRSRDGHAKTYFLAWTTTPWTLPGNVALAVGKDIEYVKVRKFTGSWDNDGKALYEKIILAKDIFEKYSEHPESRESEPFRFLFEEIPEDDYEYPEGPEVIETLKGSELIGKSYKPVFDYYANDEKLENRENGWKVYDAGFVTTESGTGIVHIAPAFGEDDLALGQKEKLPFVQHVAMNGTFKPEVKDFAGLRVKKKGDTQSGDVEVIKKLARDGTLFSKEKITHSYPLCWRCDTPLLNYAASSWFVKVTAVKDKLLQANKKIGWVPESMGRGRFGRWLEGARDWAISRSRYWGAPIPVWECDTCEKREVIGSLRDLQERLPKNGNKYFVMRHAGAESNEKRIVSSDPTDENHLTGLGKKQATDAGPIVKEENIDIIISSDLYRTKETAEIVADGIGYPKDKIVFDKRLREIQFGKMNGKTVAEYHAFFTSLGARFTEKPEGGENFMEVKDRMMQFLYSVEKEYEGKNILIVTHQDPAWMLFSGANGSRERQILASVDTPLDNAEVRELAFTPFPHNEHYELDLHRPYIDDVKFACRCGGRMHRVAEVFDCWFESGSMPYGQFHYPFESKEQFERNFPANFIAEGVDQTRGWFYNMHVLSLALFGKSAFKNVIVNGLVLAEDGQKMSKRLKNYPDPMEVAGKYGADALRYYLMASPVVRGEELNFSEKGVDEVSKKIVLRLRNVLSFYELYESEEKASEETSDNVLDRWILSRLHELLHSVEGGMEHYEIERAARPVSEFVDDLSTWYVRRSRDRFKEEGEDKEQALSTLRFVLLEFSKVLAPFMPFLAEDVYGRAGGKEQSVHLEDWPSFKQHREEENILADMQTVRDIVSRALEARTQAGVKVRQPLASLTVRTDHQLDEPFIELIKDEVNVKEVIFDKKIHDEVALDTVMTSELKEEGTVREFTRFVQSMRKEINLEPGEKAKLLVTTSENGKACISKCEKQLKKDTSLSEIVFENKIPDGKEIMIDGMAFMIDLQK